MINFLQILVEGTLVGLVYGLVAISFVVIYRASRIVNLAQGEVVVFGAFFLWTCTYGLQSGGIEVPLFVAALMTLVACVLFGLLLERLAFRPLIGQPAFAMLVTSGSWVMLLSESAHL